MTQTKIKNEFKKCSSLEDAKKVYRTLAKKLHPDMGGNTQQMQDLQAIYTHIIEHNVYFSNDSKFNINIEKIISNLLHHEFINIEVIGSWIWVTGETKAIKEELLNLGFKWASKKKAWHWAEKRNTKRSNKDLDGIRATYGSVLVAGQRPQKKKMIA